MVIPVELRIPNKGEVIELTGREGVKGHGRVTDGLGDAVKVQYRWRHGAARPGGGCRCLSRHYFFQGQNKTFQVRLEPIRKNHVFVSKYDIGGEFEESLKLSRVVGHGQDLEHILLETS